MFLVAARKSLCPFVYAEIGNFLAVTFAVVVIEVVYNLPLRHIVELAQTTLVRRLASVRRSHYNVWHGNLHLTCEPIPRI